jgi:hypothetical protein
VCSDFFGHNKSLVVRDGFHSLLSQALQGSWVFSEIQLGSNQNDGHGWRMVINLWEPLGRSGLYQHSSSYDIHTLARTLSNEGGLTIEKQMRNTSVWGYERGRSRS